MKHSRLSCVWLLVLLGGVHLSAIAGESPTKLYIIPGYRASPTDHWFPWLKQRAEARGSAATVLKMPTPSNPELGEWLKTLQESISAPDKNTFFVAHSLGCITLLRYLDSLPAERQIGGFILVSGFSSLPAGTLSKQLGPFIKDPVDYQHLRKMALQRVVIGALDDPIVPHTYTESLAKSLDAKMVTVAKGGHFMGSDGFTEFPLLLGELSHLKP